MITLLIGADADLFLRDRTSQQQWNSLYASCPWATVFQSFDFVNTWYQIYREPFKPLLITETLADGSLSGLLTLAITPDSKQLIFAGAKQAEYQTWLATSDRGDTFITAAMDLLKASFAGLTLTFGYLPPLAPKQWLELGQPWANQSRLVMWTRPLMKLGDGDHLRESLRKKANKSRLNRLKRRGDVQFEQLDGVAELTAVFDDIISHYDFRQGAINDSLYFQADPLKKPFYLALMAVPGLLHVTVLKVGDQIASAQLSLSDGKQCTLDLPAYSPFYGVHSPGKLQLLMLGLELVKQGFDTLDLTPGNDPYKERFANDHDETHVLTVFLDDRTWRKQRTELKIRARVTAGSITKAVIGAAGIELATAKKSIEQLRRLRLGSWNNRQQQRRGKIEYRVYAYSADAARAEDQSPLVNRDCLNDLLLFQPVDPGQTRQDFLSLCLTRLEAGEHVYTWVEQGRLLAVCWLVERQEKLVLSDLNQEYVFEPDSAVIHDCCLDPSICNRGFDRVLLQQIANDGLFDYGAKQVYVTVLAEDPVRVTIESTGFTYRQSIC